jgi:hypothetical protein
MPRQYDAAERRSALRKVGGKIFSRKSAAGRFFCAVVSLLFAYSRFSRLFSLGRGRGREAKRSARVECRRLGWLALARLSAAGRRLHPPAYRISHPERALESQASGIQKVIIKGPPASMPIPPLTFAFPSATRRNLDPRVGIIFTTRVAPLLTPLSLPISTKAVLVLLAGMTMLCGHEKLFPDVCPMGQ